MALWKGPRTTSVDTGAISGNTRDVYDAAPALVAHTRRAGFCDEERSAEIYVEGVVEFREGAVEVS